MLNSLILLGSPDLNIFTFLTFSRFPFSRNLLADGRFMGLVTFFINVATVFKMFFYGGYAEIKPSYVMIEKQLS